MLGNSRTTCGNAVEQAVRAQIFVDVGPVNAVAVANQCPVRSLGWRRIGESPRPGEGNTDDPSIDEVGGNDFIGDFDAADSRFNADRSAHAMPR